MGQKVNPKVIRIGITRDWDSKWYAKKANYRKLFHQDLAIEKLILEKLEKEGFSKIEIMRTQGKVIINIYTSKPGLIIGRGGEVIEKLKDMLSKKFKESFAINIKEVKKREKPIPKSSGKEKTDKIDDEISQSKEEVKKEIKDTEKKIEEVKKNESTSIPPIGELIRPKGGAGTKWQELNK